MSMSFVKIRTRPVVVLFCEKTGLERGPGCDQSTRRDNVRVTVCARPKPVQRRMRFGKTNRASCATVRRRRGDARVH